MKKSLNEKKLNILQEKYVNLKLQYDDEIPLQLKVEITNDMWNLHNKISEEKADKILKLYNEIVDDDYCIGVLQHLGKTLYIPALHDGNFKYNLIPNLIEVSKKLYKTECKHTWRYKFNTSDNHLIYLIENESYYIDVEFDESSEVKSITLYNCSEYPSFDNLCKLDNEHKHLNLYKKTYNVCDEYLNNPISNWNILNTIGYMIEYYIEKLN